MVVIGSKGNKGVFVFFENFDEKRIGKKIEEKKIKKIKLKSINYFYVIFKTQLTFYVKIKWYEFLINFIYIWFFIFIFNKKIKHEKYLFNICFFFFIILQPNIAQISLVSPFLITLSVG